ncbi:hypothetical protein HT031_006324 [Scenedesmus sp. PABB004]|nr:hypothetical protein HT031_006324 [Scenedesmus sp. PABB004]
MEAPPAAVLRGVPLVQGHLPWALAPGQSLVLGRGPSTAITRKSVSRRHVQLVCAATPGGGLAAAATAAAAFEYVRDGQAHAVGAGQTVQLLPGDLIYLSRCQAEVYAGYKLKRSSSAAPPAPPAAGAAAPPAVATPGRRAGGSPAAAGQQQQQEAAGGAAAGASPAVAAAAAAAAGGLDRAGSGGRPPVFAGVRLAVWDKHHTSRAVGLAVDEGACLLPWLDASATHVIARHEMTSDDVQRHLAADAERAQGQQWPRGGGGLPAAPPAAGGAPAVEVAAQSPRALQQAVTRKLQFTPADAAAAPASPGGALRGCSQDEGDALLPQGMHFVCARWLSDSLRAGALLPERPYLVQLQLQQSPGADGAAFAGAGAAAGAEQLPSPAPAAAVRPGAAARGAAQEGAQRQQEAVAGGSQAGWAWHSQQQDGPRLRLSDGEASSGGEGSDDAAPGGSQLTLAQRRAAIAAQRAAARQAAAAAGAAVVPPSAPLLSPKQPAAAPPLAQQLQGVVLPRPDQVRRPGEPWGTGGRWIEPWDEEAALRTVDRLLEHWAGSRHRRKEKVAARAAAAAAADAALAARGGGDAPRKRLLEGSADDTPSGSSDDDDSDDGGGGGAAAAPAAAPAAGCQLGHIACGRQRVCFVEQMQRVIDSCYGNSNQKQFQIKAARVALRALEQMDKPIEGHQDIHDMRLGPKTTAKLLEIFDTGRVGRAEAREASAEARALGIFQQVWGVAAETARGWYCKHGARSLDDVRAAAAAGTLALTSMQEAGLKYFDDFLCRIPRAEVAEAERIVAEAAADALRGLAPGRGAGEVAEQLHVRAMGSYLRGKPDCGDIDIIISPDPAAGLGSGPLLVATLKWLGRHGHITQDMLPLDHKRATRGPNEPSTWSGVYRGPSSPCHRRIDIKFYHRTQLACAVNYFSSGQDMCRALRHWGNSPRPEVAAAAARLNPEGNAFRLGDQELVVIRREFLTRPKTKRRRGGGRGGRGDGGGRGGGGRGDGGGGPRGDGDGDGAPPVVAPLAKVGDTRNALSGKSSTVMERLVGPAIRCESREASLMVVVCGRKLAGSMALTGRSPGAPHAMALRAHGSLAALHGAPLQRPPADAPPCTARRPSMPGALAQRRCSGAAATGAGLYSLLGPARGAGLPGGAALLSARSSGRRLAPRLPPGLASRTSVRTFSSGSGEPPAQPPADGGAPGGEAAGRPGSAGGGSPDGEHGHHGGEHGHGAEHGHGGAHGAVHQLQHRAAEKATFQFLEKVAERMTERVGERVTERIAERAGERVAERAGERLLERAGERAVERAAERGLERAAERAAERGLERAAERAAERGLERAAERAAERGLERAAERAAERGLERAAERAAERGLERAAERAAERGLERGLERAAERAGERAFERTAERALERTAERAGERVVERAGERALERAGERAGERLLERAGERALERTAERTASAAGARVGGHAAGRAAERAGEALAAHGGDVAAAAGARLAGAHGAAAARGRGAVAGVLDKLVDKLLGSGLMRRFASPALMSRIGRGALVGLPAVGALFVAHLAHQDWDRMREERAAGNRASAGAFAVALLGDVLDVAAHVVVVAGLLHTHFQLGVHVDHHLLHLVERGGLLVAAVGTVAATLGEVLAVRAALREERAETKARVEAAAAAAVEALDAAAAAQAERPRDGGGEAGAELAEAAAEAAVDELHAAAAEAEAARSLGGDAGWRWDGDGARGSGSAGAPLQASVERSSSKTEL